MDGVWDTLKARAMIEAGTRQGGVFGVGISFIVVVLLVLILRFYVRMSMIKAIGMDDVLMAIGGVFTFGLSIASMIAAYWGCGKHIQDILPEHMTPMLQAIYSTRLLYVVGMMFVKLSLLTFYLRLDQRPLMRWTVYSLMFVVLGLSISSFFILAFSCYPPSMFWDTTGTVKGHCIEPAEQQKFYDANGILNIITDIFIYITPMPMVWHIQIPMRQKLAVGSIFALGIVAIVAGCVRFAYVRMLANSTDMYYALADSLNWCAIEIYVAMICGSASAFKVLLKSWFPRIFGSSRGEPKYDNSGKLVGGGSHRLNYLPRRSDEGWQKPRITSHRDKGETGSTGSEEAIIPSRIMMKTELRTEIFQRDSEDKKSREDFALDGVSATSGRRYQHNAL